uniref:Uncharacterized protein n=1 Tax=Candidozyma auris TaxID=498019 RepID=A0A0L0P8S8_CANAR
MDVWHRLVIHRIQPSPLDQWSNGGGCLDSPTRDLPEAILGSKFAALWKLLRQRRDAQVVTTQDHG